MNEKVEKFDRDHVGNSSASTGVGTLIELKFPIIRGIQNTEHWLRMRRTSNDEENRIPKSTQRNNMKGAVTNRKLTFFERRMNSGLVGVKRYSENDDFSIPK